MLGIVGALRQAGRKAAQQACKGRLNSSGEIRKRSHSGALGLIMHADAPLQLAVSGAK